jgi:hypothetical protein
MSGVTVVEHPRMAVASLRHLDSSGGFAGALREHAGRALPGNKEAVLTAGGDILAWRSPTETLWLGTGNADFAGLAARTAGMSDGCVVDQTGGITGITAVGPGVADLMSRLGGASPALGESRICRLADLTVAASCVRPGEIWLLVERIHAPHLQGWIAATLRDGMV